jgi:hypothetical protein
VLEKWETLIVGNYCFDYPRQGLMCSAETTLEWTVKEKTV